MIHKLSLEHIILEFYNEHSQDLYSHEVEEMPINRAPESKASFVPSKDERNKVNFSVPSSLNSSSFISRVFAPPRRQVTRLKV